MASRKVLEAQLGSERLKLGDMPKGVRRRESTDVTRSDQPPIVVICEDQFPTPWRPNEHALSDVHLLFGELLRFWSPTSSHEPLSQRCCFRKLTALSEGLATERQPSTHIQGNSHGSDHDHLYSIVIVEQKQRGGGLGTATGQTG